MKIGIRKVSAQTVTGIARGLSKDFITRVLVAIVMGAPVAWRAMKIGFNEMIKQIA